MCRAAGLKPTHPNFELVMAEWRRKDLEERAAEREKAERELEKAQAAKQKARKKKVKHKVGSKEREQAEREEKEAEAARLAAEEAKKSAGPNAPIGNPLAAPPSKQMLEIMAVAVKIDADASRIVKTLKDNLAALDEVADQIDPAYVEMIVASHNKIITAATQLRDRFSAKNLRFKVHEGGAA
jgi:ATPase subunit of ABC transporter with duplicated ATPase domains